MFATMKDLLCISPNKRPYGVKVYHKYYEDEKISFFHTISLFKTKDEAMDFCKKMEFLSIALTLYDRRNGKILYYKDIHNIIEKEI